ncbi:MAG: hypothetical protein CSA84_06655 [Actinomycetales bacterium]|nr:MAG: hypothetical protein CSA84_06655 [Actinomycetales bacterium]
MGMFDEIKDKATDAVQDNSDKIAAGVEKAADVIDDKTGGKFTDKIDMAEEKVKGVVEDLGKKD